jgi:hypothetical protein
MSQAWRVENYFLCNSITPQILKKIEEAGRGRFFHVQYIASYFSTFSLASFDRILAFR